jgi:GNAT superfamily N-acetyltransferase
MAPPRTPKTPGTSGTPRTPRTPETLGTPWTTVLEPDPDPAIRARIIAPLVAYNDRAAGAADWGLIVVTVRDPAGEIVGGLWGRTGYGFLFVELLTAGPAAGTGMGTRLMAMAEAEARQRGLAGIWLDTWTFQAPGFYLKLGFAEVGRITNYPPGHDRIFYMKRLG